MLSWENRPVEIAYLLNPPFCGEVLRRCFFSYENESLKPFPFPLSFLVLPLILHKKTREKFSLKTRDSLDAWIHKNQEIRIGFSERAKELIPITNEALIFLFQSGNLRIGKEGLLELKNYQPKSIKEENEVSECFKKSQKVGTWFSNAGNATSVFTILGVRP